MPKFKIPKEGHVLHDMRGHKITVTQNQKGELHLQHEGPRSRRKFLLSGEGGDKSLRLTVGTYGSLYDRSGGETSAAMKAKEAALDEFARLLGYSKRQSLNHMMGGAANARYLKE